MQLDNRAYEFMKQAKQQGISKEEVFSLLQSKGYDLGGQPQQPQAVQAQPTQKRQYTPLEKVAYTLRGAGEGLGLELGDIVGGVTNTISAPIGKTVGALTGGAPLSFKDFNPWQNFKQGRKDFVREQEQFADTHPWLNAIGNFGGVAVTGVVGAGKKLATAAGKQGLKALAKQGAKEGFKWGGAYSAGAAATKDPNKISLQDALIEGPIGAGTGAVLGAALPVATVGATRGAQQFFGTKGYAKRAADKIFQKAGSKNIDDIVRTTEGTRALKEAIKADDAVAEQVRNVADKAIINGAEKTQRTVEKTLGVGDIVRARDNAKLAYNDLIKQSEAKIPQDMYKNRALQEALAQAKKNDYLGEIAQFGDDSLFTAQRTKENLDDMIEASFETGDFGKKVATDKTRQLMKIKDQFVRGLDQLEPAYKGIRKNFEDSTQAYNLLEELTKARGGERSNTINQILTNKNKGLISKIYGKEKADSLFNALRDQKVETDRFSKLYNAAENKLTKEQAKSQGLVREALESFGSIVGNAIDTARLGGATRGRRRIGEILLGMEKESKTPGFTSSIANKLKEEGGFAFGNKETQKKIADIIKAEQERIAKGYNEVLNNPLKGTAEGKFDVLAELKPSELKTFLINRGAAIKDPKTGEIIVKGRELARQTGTSRNFGFSKMIFGKGLTKEEMAQLPTLLREYEPIEITERAEIYRIPNGKNAPYKIVFNRDAGNAGKNSLVHMSRDERSAGMPFSKKKDLASQSPAIIQGKGYTDASPVETSGPNPTNSIGKKGQNVKAQSVNQAVNSSDNNQRYFDAARSEEFRKAYQREFEERAGLNKPKVRTALNSLGEPVAKTEEGAKNFKKWFGNSKVVDKEGRPLVLADNEQIYIMDGMTNEGFRKYTYQDAHRAPSFDDTPIAERMDLGGDYNLKEIAKGFSPAPEDYFSINGPRYYMYDTPTGHESFNAIREILNGNKKKITAYRAVPKDVLSNDFDNGSWITFSKKYAEQHGNNRFDGNYRIVKKEVPIENVWWDGNDINEWGFDNGKGRIKDLFVKIENPKYQDKIPASVEEANKLRKQGFDGVITPDGNYFVMGQNQIKSTKNQGTFDPKNPNIFKALIGGVGISQILKNQGERNGI